jgi:hypothetical protein
MALEDSTVTLWMRQLLAGDTDRSAQKLWERYFQKLVMLARIQLKGLPRQIQDEEDVALSAFDSFCAGVAKGRFPQLDDRDDLWRILVTITGRKVFKLQRYTHAKKRKAGSKLAMAEEPNGLQAAHLDLNAFLSKEPTPEFAAETAEEYQRLLALLPTKELRSVVQWKMEGFTNKEIAQRLNCVPRSVQRRLKLIRVLWGEDEAKL